MRFLVQQYSKTIDLRNKDKKAKSSSFKIIKGKDGVVHQIKGSTVNGESYLIQENIKKKDSVTGLIDSKHKIYKIKSSNIMNLLNEGKKNKQPVMLKSKNDKTPIKKIDSTKALKKSVKKVDVSKDSKKVLKNPVKKVNVSKDSKKALKKPVKKANVTKALKNPVKPPIKTFDATKTIKKPIKKVDSTKAIKKLPTKKSNEKYFKKLDNKLKKIKIDKK